jgi:polyisoprenoid-binding protein YceI
MHGVTKPVTTDLFYRDTIENPISKKDDTGFKLTDTIRRTAFNIGNNASARIGDDFAINRYGEFAKGP